MEQTSRGKHPGLDKDDRAGSDRLIQWRYFKDRMATVAVGIGGIGVLVAILLIFFYLAWVVLPLFAPASMDKVAEYADPIGEPALLLSVEEQAEVATHVGTDGRVRYFDVLTGELRGESRIPIPEGASIASFDQIDSNRGVFGLLLDNGGLVVVKEVHQIRFDDQGRRVVSSLDFPYGEDPIETGLGEVRSLDVRVSPESLLIAAAMPDGRIELIRYVQEVGLFGGSGELTADEQAALRLDLPPDQRIERLLLDPAENWLHVLTDAGEVVTTNIRRLGRPERLGPVTVAGDGAHVVDARYLNGGISLLVTTSDGRITQLFPVRDEGAGWRLQKVREFEAPGEAMVSALDIEQRRRGFVAADAEGRVAIYYATSHRQLLNEAVMDGPIADIALAPRADRLLVTSRDGQVSVYDVHNEHPEVSLSSLWGKVWYESYPEPDYVWQSSSATSDFEPKFSLMPLSFGTLKAAFYAMLFAMPLAICGAIYTAYFMSPELRQIVKPTIEIMEALPTVILGFLAGLWLAPVLELNMPGAFLLILMLPLAIPLSGFLWTRFPASIRHRVPDGWVPALLIPVVVFIGWLAFALSRPVEAALFGGSMPLWLNNEMGITYDQRNALVVGLAMGFAVIPTIFSIAEDAVFSVPKQLSQGSLALGATPWQTLVRVVLPTASPGMFSAVMIGMGRAVGETMIVLMATGNTPIMDMSIFQGMRTLSANIAVEMPESEVGSTHFRLLFLSGLVLFLFTFFFNTLAEVVRQRLRRKYSTL